MIIKENDNKTKEIKEFYIIFPTEIYDNLNYFYKNYHAMVFAIKKITIKQYIAVSNIEIFKYIERKDIFSSYYIYPDKEYESNILKDPYNPLKLSNIYNISNLIDEIYTPNGGIVFLVKAKSKIIYPFLILFKNSKIIKYKNNSDVKVFFKNKYFGISFEITLN
ncbi:MAG: hypothetical protein ACP5RD_05780 [bacterium]